MSQNIGGYTYYSNKTEANKHVKSNDDNVAYEHGLGWYLYSKREYTNNPRKRIFGF